MKKSFWNKGILFLLTMVFAVAGAGTFARVAIARTAAEIATEQATATNAVTAASAALETAQTNYDSAKATYDSDVSAIEYYYSGLKCATVTSTQNGPMKARCDTAAATLKPYTDALSAATLTLSEANTALATVTAEKSDETVAAEKAATEANAVPGAVPTSLNTTVDQSGADTLNAGGAGGTASLSSQADTDAKCAKADEIKTVGDTTSTTHCDGSITIVTTTVASDGSKTIETIEVDKNGTAGTPTITTQASTATTSSEDALIDSLKKACSIFTTDSEEIMACVSFAVYYVIYKPTSMLLVVAGLIFDTSITLSIDRTYVGKTFVGEVWTIIRDFSNMLFIFILLYAGIQMMLGMGNYKETIRLVIIVALLINFSLFFTKVVIDAGNILSVGIFQAMGAEKSNSPTSVAMADLAGGSLKERNLSEAISAQFHPARFLKKASDSKPLQALIVILVAAIVNGFAAYIFFKVALLFVGRLLAFWFLMIISPFAFISIAMPKGNIFGWWKDTLLDQAFVAPVFLFLMYLLMTVINSGLLSSFTSETGISVPDFLFNTLLGPILVAVMLITALKFILQITTTMAGTFGGVASQYVGQAMGMAGGVALGAATGGASLAMRGVGGSLATRFAGTGIAEKMATSDSKLGKWAGRQALTLTDKAKTGTWDIRGSSIAQATLGKGLGAVGVSLGKPSERAAGGYAGVQKRQMDKDLAYAKRLEVTDAEKRRKAAEVEPEYEKAITAREENRSKKATAEKELGEAEVAAKGSGVGQTKTAMEKNLEEKKDAAEKAKKETEAAKKKHEEVVNDPNADIATKKAAFDNFKKAEAGEQSMTKELAVAQGELDKATTKYLASEEAKTLSKVTKELDFIKGTLKVADETIKRGDKKAKEWEDKENSRRRESVAQQVEARHGTGSIDAYPVSGGFNSKQSRETTAGKIRKEGGGARRNLEKEKEATLAKFRKEIGSPDDTRPIDDPAIIEMADKRRDELEKLETDAESNALATSPGTPANKEALINWRRAQRNFKEFTEARSKVKAIEKELKENNA